MNYGIYTPNYGDQIDVRLLAEMAREAEKAGWDGFFIWDHILGDISKPLTMVDPWIALTAIAMRTEKIRIGTTVTPIARRRPWKLARETASLDHLSGGRLILSVGLGYPPDAEFEYFGEEGDEKIRAEKLDEGLEVLTGLWRGKPFQFEGKHFKVDKCVFLPGSYQQPRISIWVGGFWPFKAPFRRAARWDGVFPLKTKGRLTGKDIKDIRTYIDSYRNDEASYDVVVTGTTPGNNAQNAMKKLRPLISAGVTWWLEALYRWRNSPEDMLARIRQGPPKILD